MERSAGIFGEEFANKSVHSFFLSRSSGVLGFVVLGNTADIAHADRIGVVALAVSADLLDRTAFMDRAIAINHIVIADVLPTVALDVPLAYLVNGVVLAFRSGGAV